jgi:thiosulfate/3-mercaptopyruvate sulfurtransferase
MHALVLGLVLLATAPKQQPAPVFVSTEWLADHLNDPTLVVMHVGNESTYSSGHIPGARLAPADAWSVERDGLIMQMPDAAVLEEALEALGISDASRIVIYTNAHPPATAARLYVTLDHYGLGARTSLLDGGLRAWTAEKRATETTTPTPAASGQLTLRVQPGIVVDHAYVAARRRDGAATVIDARAIEFWTGERFNRPMATRPGRVAGAASVPFSAVVAESGRILDRAALEALFAQAGVAPGMPVVTYCHIGQQASLAYVAARHLGLQAHLYDGSYQDWSRRTELPVDSGGGNR